jgi:hypothetical protein
MVEISAEGHDLSATLSVTVRFGRDFEVRA